MIFVRYISFVRNRGFFFIVDSWNVYYTPLTDLKCVIKMIKQKNKNTTSVYTHAFFPNIAFFIKNKSPRTKRNPNIKINTDFLGFKKNKHRKTTINGNIKKYIYLFPNSGDNLFFLIFYKTLYYKKMIEPRLNHLSSFTYNLQRDRLHHWFLRCIGWDSRAQSLILPLHSHKSVSFRIRRLALSLLFLPIRHPYLQLC